MWSMDTLESLVRRARGGDAGAFEEIVRRLSRRAVATAHLVCGDLQAAEEAAQDAFLTAWRKLGTLEEPAAFSAWFGTVLVRTASRMRRPKPLPLEIEPEAPAGGDAGGLPGVVRSLKPMYREVLALRYVEGFSYREIAAALGISVARVKSRLHDGREQIRARLCRLERGGRR